MADKDEKKYESKDKNLKSEPKVYGKKAKEKDDKDSKDQKDKGSKDAKDDVKNEDK